jgi:hypothetical protein
LAAQNSAAENGIYVVRSNTIVRSDDLAVGASAFGAFVFIGSGGTKNGQQGRVCNAPPGSDIVGTHSLPWTVFTSENGKIGTTTTLGPDQSWTRVGL